LLNLGTTRLRMHRPVEAIAAADAVLASSPRRRRPRHPRHRPGAHGAAGAGARAYDRLVAAEPRLARMWSQRGSLLREMGRLDEAKASYAEAQARGDDSALTDYFLAGVAGGTPPPAAPPDYVEGLFDDYAAEFDDHLVGVLGYQGHQLLVEQPARAGAALRLGARPRLRHRPLRPAARAATRSPDRRRSRRRHARAGARARRLRPLERPRSVAWLEANRERFDLIVSADVLVYIGDLDGCSPRRGARSRAAACSASASSSPRRRRRPAVRPAAEPALHPLRPLHPRARRAPRIHGRARAGSDDARGPARGGPWRLLLPRRDQALSGRARFLAAGRQDVTDPLFTGWLHGIIARRTKGGGP
jgi:predicted TPR repeat methyltransferase